MSIEKYEIDQFVREEIPFNFTMLPNIVLDNLNDAEALGIWCHLMSKTYNWNVNREYLMNKFNIGRDKLNRIIEKLKKYRLFEYRYHRGIDGRIEKVSIIIKSGITFAKEIVKNQHDTKIDTTILKNHYTEKPLTGKTAPTKERINTKKRIILNCSSHDERMNGFDYFWSKYLKKENKLKAKEAWIKKKCYLINELITESLEKQNVSKWNKTERQYIPLASSWINAQRWEDEINTVVINKQNISIKNENNNRNELHCTVKDYGPGHPDWERINSWKKQHKQLG